MLWRRIGATILGLIVAFLIVQVAELIVHQVHRPPPGYNMQDMNDVKKYVGSLPVFANAIVLTGWMIGTVLGAFIAAKIGKSSVPAYVLGALLLIGGIAMSMKFPVPMWFSVALFVVYIGGTIVGAVLGSPHRVQNQSS